MAAHDGALAGAFGVVAVPLLWAVVGLPLGDVQRAVCGVAAAPFAVAAGVHGWRALATRRRVRRELRRAAAEWPTLCRELAAASRAGIDLHPLLQQLGYHEQATQRRLARSARRWSAKLWRHEAVVHAAAPTAPPVVAAVVVPRRVRLALDEPPLRENPSLRLVAGALLTVVCVLVMMHAGTRLWGWFLFGAAAGIGMFVGGFEAQRRRVRQQLEIDRALREWEQLATQAAVVLADGGSLVELLQRAGYRDYDVRQWLLRHLEA